MHRPFLLHSYLVISPSELINGVLKSINDLEGDYNDEYFRNLERLVFKAANRFTTFWMLFY